MSTLKLFFKDNKEVKENTFYAPTKSLRDENGLPLQWEIKPLTTKEDTKLKERCTYEVQVKGKPNMFHSTVNAQKYIAGMITASVVFPDLLDAQLQDSYGVKTPEDLLQEMVDDPGEYNEFSLFVQNFNGFNTIQDDKVEQVKN